MRSLRWTLALALTVAAMAGCKSTEENEEEHTPASARLFNAGGQELTPNLQLARGATTRVEVRYYHDDGDLITGLEVEHFAKLTFTPGTLVTIAAVAGQRFFLDLTTQNAAGTGTVMVGFGHDADADELSFGPFTVTVP